MFGRLFSRTSGTRSGDTRRSRVAKGIGALLGVVTIVTMGSSCSLDPVHRAAVDSLGEERSDLYPPESEFHRPGEPCALCHSTKGPAKRVFALAGTIFWEPDDDTRPESYLRRVDRAYVRTVDPNGVRRCFVTNCNGNFFVYADDYPNLTFPLLVSVERTVNPGVLGGDVDGFYRDMKSHIGRESSCAGCHLQGIRDFGSPGQIRMVNNVSELTGKDLQIPAVCDESTPRLTSCPEDR